MIRQLDRKIGEDSTVADVVSALIELQDSKTPRQKSWCAMENQRTRLAKVVVSHGAGTNGGYEVAKAYFNMAPTH